MQKRKTTKSKVDLSVPIDIQNLVLESDDCFGKEWLPGCIECNICHDSEVCSIIYYELVKKKKIKVQEKNATFFDLVNFDRFPWDKFLDLVKANPKKYSTKDLFDAIKKESKCDDDKTVVQVLKNWLKEHNLKTSEGYIYG